MYRTQRARISLIAAAVAVASAVAAGAPSPTPAADITDVSVFGARGVNGHPDVSGAGLTLRGPISQAPWGWHVGSDAMNWHVTLLDLDDRTGPNLALANAGLEWQWQARPFGLDSRLRLGTGPSVLSDTRLGGTRLGGRFHFMSHIALAFDPGRDGRWVFTTGAYHVSNAGLRERNPGFEIVTLELHTRVRF